MLCKLNAENFLLQGDLRRSGEKTLRVLMRLDRQQLPERTDAELDETLKEVAEVCDVSGLA